MFAAILHMQRAEQVDAHAHPEQVDVCAHADQVMHMHMHMQGKWMHRHMHWPPPFPRYTDIRGHTSSRAWWLSRSTSVRRGEDFCPLAQKKGGVGGAGRWRGTCCLLLACCVCTLSSMHLFAAVSAWSPGWSVVMVRQHSSAAGRAMRRLHATLLLLLTTLQKISVSFLMRNIYASAEGSSVDGAIF